MYTNVLERIILEWLYSIDYFNYYLGSFAKSTVWCADIYRQTSNISYTLEGNKIVDHSDVKNEHIVQRQQAINNSVLGFGVTYMRFDGI